MKSVEYTHVLNIRMDVSIIHGCANDYGICVYDIGKCDVACVPKYDVPMHRTIWMMSNMTLERSVDTGRHIPRHLGNACVVRWSIDD